MPAPSPRHSPSPAVHALWRDRERVLRAARYARHALSQQRKHSLGLAQLLCIAVPQLTVLAAPPASHNVAACGPPAGWGVSVSQRGKSQGRKASVGWESV
eukprot:364709-Chlamydomonas_euryale.AAC.23